MDVFNDKIKPLFDSSGMTDKEIETALGLPRGVIYKWQSGKYKSYKDYLPQISNYFHVSIDYTTPPAECNRAGRHPVSGFPLLPAGQGVAEGRLHRRGDRPALRHRHVRRPRHRQVLRRTAGAAQGHCKGRRYLRAALHQGQQAEGEMRISAWISSIWRWISTRRCSAAIRRTPCKRPVFPAFIPRSTEKSAHWHSR